MEEELEISKFSSGVWKKILKVVSKQKARLVFMMFTMAIVAALDVIQPFLVSKTIKTFFGENPDFSMKSTYIVYFISLAVGYAISVFLFIYEACQLEVKVGDQIRTEAFTKLQELSFSYYDKTQAGWIMARLTSDSRKLADVISWGMIDLVWGICTMSGILVMLFITNWKLALIVATLVPILFLFTILYRKVILQAERKVRKANSLITGDFSESFLGAKTTKTLVLENKKNKEFGKLCEDMRKKSMNSAIKSAIFYPVILVLAYIGVALTYYYGTDLVITRVIEASVLFLFIDYTTMFFEPIMNISRVIAELQQAQAAAERIVSLIETKVDIDDTEEVKKIYGSILEPKYDMYEPIKGDIEFKDVTFSYTQKEVVLKNFNLKVKAGMSVALVGATGSGKSTIVNLLCRFYEPTKGQILIDGVDYKERSIGWLHSNLGYVLQSPHLFNGSIKDNVLYGKKDATNEEIMEALRIVKADEIVSKLEKGIDTQVGEGGSKLSIGEKQLISFARAIIRDPKILVLDEATSSIDTETEVLIQEAIDKVMKGRTTFIVAHRLSTIINADLILVIMNGEIKEAGTHRELINKKGEYYTLYKNQFINEKIQNTSK